MTRSFDDRERDDERLVDGLSKSAADPDPMALASWLDGRADEVTAAAIEARIADDPDWLAAVAALRQESPVAVPRDVLERATALMRPSPLTSFGGAAAPSLAQPAVRRWTPSLALAAGLVFAMIAGWGLGARLESGIDSASDVPAAGVVLEPTFPFEMEG